MHSSIAPFDGTTASVSSISLDKKLAQNQLLQLFHAVNCQQQEVNGQVPQCEGFAHCRAMKNVLIHMKTCKAGHTCSEPHCQSYRQMFFHFKHCTRRTCPLCLPLRQEIKRKQRIGERLCGRRNQSSDTSIMQRQFGSLRLPVNTDNMANIHQVIKETRVSYNVICIESPTVVCSVEEYSYCHHVWGLSSEQIKENFISGALFLLNRFGFAILYYMDKLNKFKFSKMLFISTTFLFLLLSIFIYWVFM